MVKVFIHGGGEREEFLREVLEPDFEVLALPRDRLGEPGAGDVLLVDLVPEAAGWLDCLEGLRRSLGDQVRLLAVLRYDQMRALDHRAPLDDFVVDGATGEEIRARLRRMAEERTVATAAVGELEIDEDRYEARLGGQPVGLTFKEFELLRFLMSRPGKVFTREVLLEQVWGYDYFGGARTVDVHVRRIRSKIEREGHIYIRTVRGVGYIFEHTPPT